MITITRYHDISAGHRVYGHESKCKHLHGHNYRIHFMITAPELDSTGRIIDFSVIKSKLCDWLEENWDHKTLLFEKDPFYIYYISELWRDDTEPSWSPGGIIDVPFNPTAENMAKYLVEVIGPKQLEGTGCSLMGAKVEETAKCSATYLRPDPKLMDKIEQMMTEKIANPLKELFSNMLKEEE
jgi:6-pyruvoyltetrahydropterin/6-carboxytetrahydropterin synthase